MTHDARATPRERRVRATLARRRAIDVGRHRTGWDLGQSGPLRRLPAKNGIDPEIQKEDFAEAQFSSSNGCNLDGKASRPRVAFKSALQEGEVWQRRRATVCQHSLVDLFKQKC